MRQWPVMCGYVVSCCRRHVGAHACSGTVAGAAALNVTGPDTRRSCLIRRHWLSRKAREMGPPSERLCSDQRPRVETAASVAPKRQ